MMNMNPIRMHADPREARPEPVKRARFDESMGRYLGKPVDFYSSIITRQKMRLYLSPRDDPLVVQVWALPLGSLWPGKYQNGRTMACP